MFTMDPTIWATPANVIYLPALGLEARMKSHEEGMVGGLLKHMLFCLNPVNILNTQKESNKQNRHKNQCPIEIQCILSVSRGYVWKGTQDFIEQRLKSHKGSEDGGTGSSRGAASGCEETYNGRILRKSRRFYWQPDKNTSDRETRLKRPVECSCSYWPSTAAVNSSHTT